MNTDKGRHSGWRPFALLLLLLPISVTAKNGFDLSHALVPERAIKRGGPPRDGIVALTAPEFVAASEARFLKPADRVLGIDVQGVTKAYPVRYLMVHEIINDVVGTQHFVVTYCPLCGSGIAFAANAGAEVHLNFGVSGLLYNSDLLMYDRNTESLWSQLGGRAIVGKLAGTRLPKLVLTHTTWQAWSSEFPGTLVMQGHPKFTALYRRNPYPGYARSKQLYFGVEHRAPDDYHPKEMVLGVELGGVFKAYPFVELAATGHAVIRDTIAGQRLLVRWDEANLSARAETVDGRRLPADSAYWFAWYAFHPDTEVFRADRHLIDNGP